MSRQAGSAQNHKSVKLSSTTSLPRELLKRASEKVGYSVFYLDKLAASQTSSFIVAKICTLIGIPLRVCHSILHGAQWVLGVEQRPVLYVQRKKPTKDTRPRLSEHNEENESSQSPVRNADLGGGGLRDEIKFDFTNSPGAATKLLNSVSPSKRRIGTFSSQNDDTDDNVCDSDEDEDYSCEEDSSADEIIDYYKVLNGSDCFYKSSDDADFNPGSELCKENEEEEEEGASLSVESESEFTTELQESPCNNDNPHTVYQLVFNEQQNGEAPSTLSTTEKQVVDSVLVDPCEESVNEERMALKATENLHMHLENGNDDGKFVGGTCNAAIGEGGVLDNQENNSLAVN